MKRITIIILSAIFMGSLWAQADDLCPVCRAKLVDVASQKDDDSKPSRNLAVWNRSICANAFFGKGSWICPRDGYAYESQLKRWELSLENRDSFAHPIDRRIHGFPLPDPKTIKSRTVYSQEFVTLKTVEHGLLFWTMLDDRYFTTIREYAKTNGIELEIESHNDLGQAVVKASVTTKTEQDGGGQPAIRPESK